MNVGRTRAFRSVLVPLAVCVVTACERDPGEPSPAQRAAEEMRRLAEEVKERIPDDPVGWTREDLERYGDWEYRIVRFARLANDALEQELNTLGEERWEAFWIERTEAGFDVFLKRPAVSYLRSVPFSAIPGIVPGRE